MSEQLQISQESEPPSETSNVVPFGGERRRHEPQPSDEELAEYRRIRPALLAMLEQFPTLLREHQAIVSNCVLAKKILAGEP